jgi:hypothetical protein|mmetsp:Transcript_10784/g.17748  ORF Transcript_10784/g.17748 Transcript_10784/m.17748 type:complete len:221 (+) Transcript_10784:629-1291(+)
MASIGFASATVEVGATISLKGDGFGTALLVEEALPLGTARAGATSLIGGATCELTEPRLPPNICIFSETLEARLQLGTVRLGAQASKRFFKADTLLCDNEGDSARLFACRPEAESRGEVLLEDIGVEFFPCLLPDRESINDAVLPEVTLAALNGGCKGASSGSEFCVLCLARFLGDSFSTSSFNTTLRASINGAKSFRNPLRTSSRCRSSLKGLASVIFG